MMSPFSLYFHIPFCQVRCAYCDFNTYAGLNELMPAYVKAMVKEIRLAGEAQARHSHGQQVTPLPKGDPLTRAGGPGVRARTHTIFFGGGTPSLLPLSLLAELLAALRDSFALTPDCEITLEANPGTVDADYLAGLLALGVNRLSFGVQSAQPGELKLLDRPP